EHRFKKALEVVCAIVALVIIIYGYVITGSFLLGVMTLFIVAIIFIGFLLSYLLPRIRSKFKNRSGDIKDEGKEKGDFEYDVGRELGRDMKKGLEENWKSHVIAGVIAIGCSLPVILLKLPWYITIIAVSIFYQIADYILSKLNQHLDLDKCPDG
ncbi:MAG: hypothetical protein L6N95_00070, partial [Candidatus Methylarchaceae archaeon HK01B]|nr:hypothetical protein [Candidatus Methylarchaceae archaeon HK01B]